MFLLAADISQPLISFLFCSFPFFTQTLCLSDRGLFFYNIKEISNSAADTSFGGEILRFFCIGFLSDKCWQKSYATKT